MQCPKCHKEVEELIHMEWEWVDATGFCKECMNNLLVKEECTFFQWKYYSRFHPDVTRCDSCSCLLHRKFHQSSGWYCLHCFMKYRSSQGRYCPTCGVIHRGWVCNAWLVDNSPVTDGRLNFTVRRESKSWSARGEQTECASYVKSIWQYQTEREVPEEVSTLLSNFYYWKKFNHYYTREPIDIEWTVKYNNTQVLATIMNELNRLRKHIDYNVENWEKVSRYRNYYLKWISDDWLITWAFIDTMWNVRERSESINKFYDDIWMSKTNEVMSWEFKYRLSSDLKHKIKAFKLNEKVHSCQKKSNCDSYARGAYDAITNGCNCPILIYNKNGREPFARITTRIMYDKDWQEYILIDRLYHSWQFQDALLKWEVYKAIVKDLKAKWYKVIASNYSAHDESTYAYLASLWMKSDTVITDLCQPLRRLNNGCGYYCDWWTVVRSWTIDDITWTTDYLDKAYLL